ncbi:MULTISPECIES: hypothetical protein [Bradyrhizobium]|nr:MULTISPECIES: hypothetical protein [Bradyrhizobium]MCP1747529.1 hypothetical protein [Bradyrhizobium japonicum]MCP1865195.1 hypothetical protein [Bradyrhizobium japonicum]MCP1896032.1 hypothetical protein [Bradyrhizobium japonicum]MCW2329418.1 hypothetical protein [Bradyrhizobium japonicum]WLB97081.1 hypothetical protein QIH92_47640 [Bradyrhizobium japonicum USDA 123]
MSTIALSIRAVKLMQLCDLQGVDSLDDLLIAVITTLCVPPSA